MDTNPRKQRLWLTRGERLAALLARLGRWTGPGGQRLSIPRQVLNIRAYLSHSPRGPRRAE